MTQAWVALFRGINVGGRNIVPMAELKEMLQSLNYQEVSTYIQSGNVVFHGPAESKNDLRNQILESFEQHFDFRPELMLLSSSDFSDALDANPFPQAADFPKTLYFFFLESQPTAPDLAALDALASSTERFKLIGPVFYLYAPDGMGRSRLASAAERKLGVAATARNLNTVKRLAAMLP